MDESVNSRVKASLDKISQLIPGGVQDWVIIEKGWNNLVLEINQSWIFRFPRDAQSQRELRRETTFLDQFVPKCQVRIPKFIFKDAEFVGYRKVEGKQLSPSVWQALSETEKQCFLTKMASFLTELHSFPFSHPDLSHRAVHEHGFFETILPTVTPLLSEVARDRSKRYFAPYQALQAFDSLLHCDLSSDHILMTAAIPGLPGVIDFGDLALGDPAIDFVGLLESLPLDDFVALVRHYLGKSVDEFVRRVEFHRRKSPFIGAAHAMKLLRHSDVRQFVSEIEGAFESQEVMAKG